MRQLAAAIVDRAVMDWHKAMSQLEDNPDYLYAWADKDEIERFSRVSGLISCATSTPTSPRFTYRRQEHENKGISVAGMVSGQTHQDQGTPARLAQKPCRLRLPQTHRGPQGPIDPALSCGGGRGAHRGTGDRDQHQYHSVDAAQG